MKIGPRQAPVVSDGADDAVDVEGVTVAPAIVRELAPWYVERHSERDTRQTRAISSIDAAFKAYEPVLAKWKKAREADEELPISKALTKAADSLLAAIVRAAATAGVTCTVEDRRLRFVSGDNLLVRFTKSLAGNLGTDAVYAPLELAERGSRGTFIHSPRTMLLSELGIRTLRPQTTELHEARHAHHFALHREGNTPTILDARLVPGFGAEAFTVRAKGYLSGFSVDEIVTHGLQAVQDRGALSLALRGEGTDAQQLRAFKDAAARAKKHASDRNGPKLSLQLADDTKLMLHELGRALTLDDKINIGALSLTFKRSKDGSLRCSVGNPARKTTLRLNIRDEQTARAFERAIKKRDVPAFTALVATHVTPWMEKLSRFSSEMTALFAHTSRAADALAAEPTTANARTLEQWLSRLGSTIRSQQLLL